MESRTELLPFVTVTSAIWRWLKAGGFRHEGRKGYFPPLFALIIGQPWRFTKSGYKIRIPNGCGHSKQIIHLSNDGCFLLKEFGV